MSETVILMVREIIEVCLIPLLGVLVTYLVKYIEEQKIIAKQKRIEEEKKAEE